MQGGGASERAAGATVFVQRLSVAGAVLECNAEPWISLSPAGLMLVTSDGLRSTESFWGRCVRNGRSFHSQAHADSSRRVSYRLF